MVFENTKMVEKRLDEYVEELNALELSRNVVQELIDFCPFKDNENGREVKKEFGNNFRNIRNFA